MWKSLILFFACLLPSWGAGCSASWGNGYTYCRAVTINHIHVSNTSQTNFPVLVTGTLTYLKTVGNGGRVQSATGYDILFTSDQNGGTVLKFERAVWSATTGLVEFWLKIPSVSATSDVTFYMFYGKSGVVVDPADPTNVWDSHYKGVYHMGDGTTLTLTDSTSNGNNGTNHSATACAGQVVGAACFDRNSNQYIDLGNNSSLEITSALTLESWVQYTGPYPLSSSTFPRIITNETSTNGYDLLLYGDSGFADQQVYYFQTLTGGFIRPLFDLSPIIQNAIYSVSSTYDSAVSGNNAILYMNGSLARDNNFGNSAIGASTQTVTIGRSQIVTDSYWNGFIDEVRISDIARDSDWIATGYANTTSPNTFYTIGNETQNQGGGGLRIYVFR